ncbi:hypothetical protein T05_4195 [Trichinella murrelli]|uniref:Uncharacterized protein n=1 Tax=Trichinella murrelli TaxID=144512 RepID=A0A0V0TCA9_9BILA|nr:hypothetical protein T05_4195 [Trichinella murrelli]
MRFLLDYFHQSGSEDQNIASDTASHSSLMLVDCNSGLLLRGRECPILLCVPELFESFSILFLVMADVPELHLVPNRCGIWSNSVVWFTTLNTDPISVGFILSPGWGCLTPITDSCRFELDELRHWARDHAGRRPDTGRSRDATAAQVQFRNHADRALGSRDVVLQDQHQIFATISRGVADGIAISGSIAGGHVLLAAILENGLQLPGSPRTHDRSATETVIKGGVRGVHPTPMSVRFSEDLPQRFLDRADEAFPVASHPRGSLRDEFPVDAVAYQLTLDSVHVHVSPELPQL